MQGFDFWLLFGRLHPMVLHFPIALLLTAAIAELARLTWRRDWLEQSGLALLMLGTASAVLAASMGLALSVADGYAGDTLERHRAFGITVAVTACAALWLRLRPARIVTRPRAIDGAALALCVIAVVGAGRYGGELARGRGFVSSAMPRILAGVETPITQAMLERDPFSATIEPILERHCYRCHSDETQEGGLRLDRRDAALAGGDSGRQAIVPGAVDDSEIVRRLFLPRDDEHAMPAENRKRPDPAELVALLDWIAAGAPWPGDVPMPTRLLADVLGESAEPPGGDALAGLLTIGARVEALSAANPLLAVDLSRSTENASRIADALHAVRNSVAWLDLSGTPVDDDLLDTIADMRNLTRLDLADNATVDDRALHRLGALETLYSLNLAGTAVTASGVRRLSDNPNLSQLFLWRTVVTEDDREVLRVDLPQVRLNFGARLAEPTPMEENDG